MYKATALLTIKSVERIFVSWTHIEEIARPFIVIILDNSL